MERAEKKISYEDNVNRLEEILDKMESNDTPLEQNLKLYEEGMKIIKLCQTELSNAESRVEKFVQDSNYKIEDSEGLWNPQ